MVIRKLRSSMGMTILPVEHHLDLVVPDWITVPDYGAVIADEEPADIRRNERVIAAILDRPMPPLESRDPACCLMAVSLKS